MAITINVNLDEILAALKNDLAFTGNADKYIKVNATADGFEFAVASGGGGTWGSITGTLSSQTDLQSALNLKANLAGAAFTGEVSVTTSGSGDTLQLTNSGSGTTLNILNSGSGDFFTVDSTKFVIDNGGDVSIGTASALARFHLLTGSTSKIGAIIQAAAGQTANTFEIRDSGGNIELSHLIGNGLLVQNYSSGSGVFLGNARGSSTVAFELQSLSSRRFRVLANATATTFESSNQTGGFIFNKGATINSSIVSDIPLTIQAAAGQTANLFEINSSSGSGGNLFRVEDDGYMAATSGLFYNSAGTYVRIRAGASNAPSGSTTPVLSIRDASDIQRAYIRNDGLIGSSFYATADDTTVALVDSSLDTANYPAGLNLGSSGIASWGSGAWFSGKDIGFSRISAGLIGVGNGSQGSIAGKLAAAAISLGTSSINASAILQADSTTQGFLPPRMTGAQVEAIATPAEGLIAYATNAGAGDVTAKGLYIYNGTNWVSL